MNGQGVLIDTAAWIELFSRPESAEKRTIDLLIDSDRVVVCGVVLPELLQRTRTDKEFRQVRDNLRTFLSAEMDPETWEEVGRLGSASRRKGVTIPLTDLAVAALAQVQGLQILTRDTHYQEIPGVRLMKPL